MRKLFTTLILLCTISISCRKPCDEVKGLNSSSMAITLFHRGNNEYFYTENTLLSPYNKDSLKITDSDGLILRQAFGSNQDRADPLKVFYVVGITPIFNTETDQDAFNKEKIKYIYIKYNYNAADTLKLVYKARKTKCSDAYEYLKVFHRDTLVASATNDYAVEFILNH